MFTGCHQHGGLATVKEVMRVIGVQGQRLGGNRPRSDGKQDNTESKWKQDSLHGFEGITKAFVMKLTCYQKRETGIEPA